MRRTAWIGLLAVLAFAGFLLARFPAAWAAAVLPRGLSCEEFGGTVWSGSCAGLRVQHQPILGDLLWQVHPLRLLALRLAARVQLTQARADAHGELEFARGELLQARDLHASFDLNPALIPVLPANVTGQARADLTYLEMRAGRLVDVRGRIEVHELAQHEGADTALGSYALVFGDRAPGAELAGELHDLGGPLSLAGTLRMTPEPGFVVDGKVAVRAGAAPELARQLQILGPPDAQGRRSFSIANTF